MDKSEDNPRHRDLDGAQATTLGNRADEAADFYAHLPAAARRSLHAMAALAEDHAIGAAARAAGRGIVQVGIDLARRRGREAAKRAYPDGQLSSEQAAETEAVRLAREAWAASR